MYERARDREEKRTSPEGPATAHTQIKLSGDGGSMPMRGEMDKKHHGTYQSHIDHT